jgi:hypothetical protein
MRTAGVDRGYIQSSNSTLFINSLTGNDIQFQGNSSTKMTITASGNVGIGTTSPSKLLHLYGSGAQQWIQNTSSTSYASIAFLNNNGENMSVGMGGSSASSYTSAGYITTGGTQPLVFGTNDTERMRITSGGDLCINTTGLSVGAKLQLKGAGSASAMSIDIGTNGYPAITFQNASGAQQGYIVTNASSVQYLSISDYRLKEDLKEIKGIEKISAIKVYDYQWKNSEDRMDGVLAHELQQILPYAVHGEKDGENMQGVDYSKIVPVLIAAIQELKAEIDLLKSK